MFNKIPIGGRLLTENVEALLLEDGSTLLWDSEKQVVSFDNLKAGWNFTESLEWKTDVIKAYESEQRIAVRVFPRIKYNYQFLLTEQEYREIRAILRSWNGASEWLNLLWIDAVTISSVTSSDTVLTFNTTTANYQVGQYIAVVEQNDTVHLYEIDLVTTTSITIDGPLAFTANNVRVMPVDIVSIPKGFAINRGANNKNFANVTLESSLNYDLSTAGNFVKYKSLDVLLESQPILNGMDELLMQSVDVFDNDQGLIEYVDSSS